MDKISPCNMERIRCTIFWLRHSLWQFLESQDVQHLINEALLLFAIASTSIAAFVLAYATLGDAAIVLATGITMYVALQMEQNHRLDHALFLEASFVCMATALGLNPFFPKVIAGLAIGTCMGLLMRPDNKHLYHFPVSVFAMIAFSGVAHMLASQVLRGLSGGGFFAVSGLVAAWCMYDRPALGVIMLSGPLLLFCELYSVTRIGPVSLVSLALVMPSEHRKSLLGSGKLIHLTMLLVTVMAVSSLRTEENPWLEVIATVALYYEFVDWAGNGTDVALLLGCARALANGYKWASAAILVLALAVVHKLSKTTYKKIVPLTVAMSLRMVFSGSAALLETVALLAWRCGHWGLPDKRFITLWVGSFASLGILWVLLGFEAAMIPTMIGLQLVSRRFYLDARAETIVLLAAVPGFATSLSTGIIGVATALFLAGGTCQYDIVTPTWARSLVPLVLALFLGWIGDDVPRMVSFASVATAALCWRQEEDLQTAVWLWLVEVVGTVSVAVQVQACEVTTAVALVSVTAYTLHLTSRGMIDLDPSDMPLALLVISTLLASDILYAEISCVLLYLAVAVWVRNADETRGLRGCVEKLVVPPRSPEV